TPGAASLGVGDPQQAVRLGGVDRGRTEPAQLGDVLDEEDDRVIGGARYKLGIDVGRAGLQEREVAIRRVQDRNVVLQRQAELFGDRAEPEEVGLDRRQRALGIQMAHGHTLKGKARGWAYRARRISEAFMPAANHRSSSSQVSTPQSSTTSTSVPR